MTTTVIQDTAVLLEGNRKTIEFIGNSITEGVRVNLNKMPIAYADLLLFKMMFLQPMRILPFKT